MTRKITILAVAIIATIGLARGHAWAIGSETPGAGLTGTIHDFSPGGSWASSNTTTVGQCTFCHTPHGAISTTLLWNHELSGETYSWDINNTMAGTPFPSIVDATWQGPTAKCLSCHDGTVAVGAINWFNAGYGQPGHWTGGVSPYIATPINPRKASLQGLTINSPTAATLSGVHPVAMPYPYGGVANTYNGVLTGGAFQPSQWATTPGGNVRLYMQSGSTISIGYNGATTYTNPSLSKNAGIECSSCHDPHNKLTVDGYFLVGMATGNGSTYLCTMCHLK